MFYEHELLIFIRPSANCINQNLGIKEKSLVNHIVDFLL